MGAWINETTSQDPSNPVCRTVPADLEPSFTEIFFMSFEMLIIVCLSHLLHPFFKRFGQPSIVSQMAAGLLVGRTLFSRVVAFQLYNLDDDDHLINMATMGSSFFMFLIGLEMDFQFLRQSFRVASIITVANITAGTIITIIVGPTLYKTIGFQGGRLMFVFIFIILLSNSSSPMLIRMMTELKLTMSGVGRIGISTSVINDAACLVAISLVVLLPKPTENAASDNSQLAYINMGIMALIGVCAVGLRIVVMLINRTNLKQQVVPDIVLWILLVIVFGITSMIDNLGFQSMITGFILGVAFPRVGPAARTVTSKLTAPVNALVLPVYFGYAGAETDLFMLGNRKVLATVVTIVISGTFGKVVSTILAAKFMGMKMKEGMVLGFLLNVKGHVELMVISFGSKFGIWGAEVSQALLIGMLISSMTAGPVAAYIVRRERRTLRYQSCGLEWMELDKELHMMTCVHSPHDIPSVIDLVQLSSGNNHTPFSPYIMHLIEFTSSITTTMLYNQIQEDKEDLRGQNIRQVNAAVDAFNFETGIKLRQLTAVSRLATMHEDLVNAAQEVRASLIIIPYYRKQRFDGKMGAGKEGMLQFNVNMLQYAPCTIGILVDRGLGGGGGGAVGGTANSVSAVSGKQTLYEIAVLFLGGPDDREAVAYGSRIAMHPCARVTVVRLMSSYGNSRGVSRLGSTNSHKSSEVLVDVESSTNGPDEEFMTDFQERFVMMGIITYVEQIVENSADTVATLASMERMYSLFIVGRQRHGHTAHLTEGLSMWQECKELGEIGDLLASSDFMFHGSVLVVQQHNASKAVYI